jgi:type IV pilus biogenesis protein CpaD/CtpE
MRLPVRAVRRRTVRWSAALAAIAALGAAACSHNQQPDIEDDSRPDPIVVHVKNENFLDMNIAVVANGVSRRLGAVNGNGAADFNIPWSLASARGITLTAVPIGSRGIASSPTLNVGPGQVVEFKVGSSLRQTTATVHDPQ